MSLKIFTKEYLEEHYVRQNKSARAIAEENGYRSVSAIHRALDYHGIRKKNGKPSKALTKELLHQLYIVEEKSVKAIARELGLRSHTSVRLSLRQHGLPVRDSGWFSTARKLGHIKRRKGYGEISGSYWCSVRHSARLRGLALDVTIEQAWQLFLQQGRRCALSGVKLKFAQRRDVINDPDSQTASLDRKDSNKPYTLDNVQWIHKRLQWMKCDFPDEEFQDWCKKVAKYASRSKSPSI